jgi:hypothetical protein
LKSRAALSTAISNPEGIPVAAFEDLNAGILQNSDPETDSLGFYLTSQKSRNSDASKLTCQDSVKDLQCSGNGLSKSQIDQQSVEQNVIIIFNYKCKLNFKL